jgi:hypothetical protein
MSDLNATCRDRARPIFSRKAGHLAPRADRGTPRGDLAWALAGLVGWCACVRAAAPPSADAAERAVVWVDGAAPAGGDGSRGRPLRAVPEGLPAHVELHLVSGVYEGPFTLPPGARVEGHGEVVLHAAAPAVVVTGEGLTLTRVSVQGGGVGVQLRGAARLERVRVSGHRQVGVEVAEGAKVELEHLDLVGTIPDSVGLRARGATLRGAGVTLSGGLRHGLKLEGGAATLSSVSSEGGGTTLHARDVDLTADGVKATAGRGPAVFLSGGAARLSRLEVEGHDSALHALRVTRLEVSRLRSNRSTTAGVLLQGTTGTLRDVVVTRTGTGGGLQALDSDVTLEDLRVQDAIDTGLVVLRGKARLRRAVFERVAGGDTGRGEQQQQGDALMLREATVEVDEVTVRDVEGSALFASAYAVVTVGRLTCERSGGGLAFLERGAAVKARTLTSLGSLAAAVVAPNDARLDVDTLRVRGASDGPVFAGCDAGARVAIGTLESTQDLPASPCVTVGRRVTASP